jgi:hypothetical protein
MPRPVGSTVKPMCREQDLCSIITDLLSGPSECLVGFLREAGKLPPVYTCGFGGNARLRSQLVLS